MASKNSKQMITGKAFEYALTMQFDEKLNQRTNVTIIKNSSFNIAKDCFNSVSDIERSEYLLYASFSVNFLIDIEPRLYSDLGKDDILQLEILSDDKGKEGDVRDVLVLRALQKWEIGVSAKNNHKAVKHPRLSPTIDFGKKWLGINASQSYFDNIRPIFNKLRKIKEDSNGAKLWKDLENCHSLVYVPILNAFKNELINLNKKHSGKVATNLVSYLVGTQDFYKVIKLKNAIEIHAYNLHGTLNKSFNDIEPKFKTPQVELPTEILDIAFKENSKSTVIVTLNHGWVLSFRIHNASSRVETSLKFDIQLIQSPKSLFTNKLNIT